MSVVVELQKLMDWIADLRKPEAPAPAETPLTKRGWELVAGRMRAAAAKFGELVEAIEASPVSRARRRSPKSEIDAAAEWNLLLQLCRDLRRESQNLELRARVLALRGEPADRFEEELTKIVDAERTTANAIRDEALARRDSARAVLAVDRLREAEARALAAGELDEFRREHKAEHDELKLAAAEEARIAASGKQWTAEDIVKVAKAAQRPIETAMKKLRELGNPDWTASSFLDELDALAESALQVVQRSEHAKDLATGQAAP